MPARTSTVPSVPTSLVKVELTDKSRRGAVAAVTAHPPGGADEQDTTGGPWLGPGAAALWEGWRSVVESNGDAGQVYAVPSDGVPAWLVGVGDRQAGDWRAAGGALVRAIGELADSAAHPATLDLRLPDDVGTEELHGLVLGVTLGGYRFRVTGEGVPTGLRTVRLRVAEATPQRRAAVERASVLAGATALARDMANMPSNVKDPAWLAATAERICRGIDGLDVAVRGVDWLAERGFGGVLAVGGGSARPPRLIELRWQPEGGPRRSGRKPGGRRADGPHLVLVGKGITFDTGGISIKPADGMHLMRTDMSGGAAVIAAMRAIAELKLPVRVSGLVPAAENHVSGSAYRPGDVIRHYGGKTTEVTNTDAEGRMVLADALAYAVDTLSPDMLVDVATLTGAMKVALGLRTGGLFASSDELAEHIEATGAEVGEAWWRMPLLDSLAEDVVSELADLRQCPPGPGGITAALFLREFTAGLPWAHLDIAGPARAEAAYAEVVPGGTGFAARTLVGLAESLASGDSHRSLS